MAALGFASRPPTPIQPIRPDGLCVAVFDQSMRFCPDLPPGGRQSSKMHSDDTVLCYTIYAPWTVNVVFDAKPHFESAG
jgi:hypothetical protein